MFPKRFILAILFLLCTDQLLAQSASKSKNSIIPFILTPHNNLSIKAILNEKDTVDLMFHLAASAVTLTEEALKKIKSVSFDRTDSVSSWGGAGNTSRHSKSNDLRIGEITWKSLPIWENKNSGPATDGKFGLDLFKDKVVMIDFEKKELTLSQELPKNTKDYHKASVNYEDDMMFIEAASEIGNKVFKNRFLIHSGYAGTILFDDLFSSTNKLSEQLKTISEKQLKDSYGNVLKTKKAILPRFSIGSLKLEDIPVGFFDGAIGRQKMSILGGDVLKRFNIIIDANRQFIYLKPNKLIKTPYLDV